MTTPTTITSAISAIHRKSATRTFSRIGIPRSSTRPLTSICIRRPARVTCSCKAFTTTSSTTGTPSISRGIPSTSAQSATCSKEWSTAARKANIRYGVSFHHEYTWWWWQTAFRSDKTGPKAGVPYDGHLTLADGKGKWWEGIDPRLLYGIDLREYKGWDQDKYAPASGILVNHLDYCRWYATRWALRIMDVINNYDPDFIYTDGVAPYPFFGEGQSPATSAMPPPEWLRITTITRYRSAAKSIRSASSSSIHRRRAW